MSKEENKPKNIPNKDISIEKPNRNGENRNYSEKHSYVSSEGQYAKPFTNQIIQTDTDIKPGSSTPTSTTSDNTK